MMSKNTKIIIGVVAGLLVLCLIACGVGVLALGWFGNRVASSVKEDPAGAASAAAQIADIPLPAGYQADASMEILGIKFITFKNLSDEKAMMMLAQVPDSGQSGSLDVNQIQKAMQQQSGQNLSGLKTIDSRTATVRGQPASVLIQEGENANNETFRQMIVTFQGKGGLALLTVFGPSQSWDQSAYDQMIESIQ
jgi:hypothetical protein